MQRFTIIALISVSFLFIITPYIAAGDDGACEALNRTIDKADLTGTFAEAIEECGRLSQTPIKVDWSSLAETGVTQQTKVVLQASDVTMERLLTLLLNQASQPRHPLSWYVNDGAIYVTTQVNLLMPALHSAAFTTAEPDTQSTPADEQAEDDQTPAEQPPRTSQATQLNLRDATLEDAIDAIRNAADLNIHVNWRSLEEVGITRDDVIAMDVAGVTIAKMLDLITEDISTGKDKFSSVYWMVDEGIVRITTGHVLNKTFRTRVYDIGDMLMVVPDFPGPRIELSIGEEAESRSVFRESEEPEKSPAEQRKEFEESLIEVVKQLAGEDMWQPQGEGSITILGNQMIITQSLLGYRIMASRAK